MANWKYVGFDKKRKKVVGQIEALTEREVRKVLRSQGIRPKEISPPSILELDLGEWIVEKGLAPPFTSIELLHFTRQLSVMLSAGIPILRCLEILYKSQMNPNFKRTIKKIAEDVGAGKSFSDAIDGKRGFSSLYVNLCRAGEKNGQIDEILVRLVQFIEKQEKIKSQLKSAMTYPAIVVSVGCIVVFALMAFVVPRMEEMVLSFGGELPGITKIVIGISRFVGEYAALIIVGAIIGVLFFLRSIKTKEGKPSFDKFMMNMPLIGDVIIKGNLASFTRTLSTMIGSGVEIIDSLDICIASIDNMVMAKDLTRVRNEVVEGKNISDPLSRITYFPEMVSQMIKVGEETGNISTMLHKTSDIFEEEVGRSVESMSKLIEPVLLLVIGGLVAVIMIAMYLPMMSLSGGFN